jgi:hypothetical protein
MAALEIIAECHIDATRATKLPATAARPVLAGNRRDRRGRRPAAE